MRIGEKLVQEGVFTQEQIEEVLEYQKEHPGKLFGQIAVELGYTSEETLEKCLQREV